MDRLGGVDVVGAKYVGIILMGVLCRYSSYILRNMIGQNSGQDVQGFVRINTTTCTGEYKVTKDNIGQ